MSPVRNTLNAKQNSKISNGIHPVRNYCVTGIFRDS